MLARGLVAKGCRAPVPVVSIPVPGTHMGRADESGGVNVEVVFTAYNWRE